MYSVRDNEQGNTIKHNITQRLRSCHEHVYTYMYVDVDAVSATVIQELYVYMYNKHV